MLKTDQKPIQKLWFYIYRNIFYMVWSIWVLVPLWNWFSTRWKLKI